VPGGAKTLIAALAALLVLAGLAACGGDDDGASSTATEAAPAQGGASPGGSPASDGGGASQGNSSDDEGDAGRSGGDGAGDFTPTEHEDSGGGSEQFRVAGGDNSVQEFGAEASASEFDEAAAALHNFLDARAAGDWEAACSYLSSQVVESFKSFAAQAKRFEDEDCAGLLEALTSPSAKPTFEAEAKRADVGSLRIEGERAFILYRALGDTVMAMPMTVEGGDWKVGSLASTPLN
jgi:hypothetical protein